jgi:hypothetical protein
VARDCSAYIEELERELKIHIDAENAEVLESDPEAKATGALYEMAVKAAKPAYDEAVRAAQEASDETVRPARLALEQANAKALANLGVASDRARRSIEPNKKGRPLGRPFRFGHVCLAASL